MPLRSAKKGRFDAAELNKRTREAFAFTSFERRKYLLTAQFCEGNQWVNVADGRVQPVAPQLRGDGTAQHRVTDNFMGPAKRRVLARLNTPLLFEVPSVGFDDAGNEGKRTAEEILDHTAAEHDWAELDREFLDDMLDGGYAAIVLEWDPGAGTALGISPVTGREFGTGDIRCFVAGPAEIAFEPGARRAEKAGWMVVRRGLPADEVQRMYGLASKPKADARPADGVSTGDDTKDLTTVVTYYERPTRNTKGGVAVIVGNDIVHEGEWPFPFRDRLNAVVGRAAPRKRRWTGSSFLWDGIPRQIEVNVARSKLLEHFELVGDPKIIMSDTHVDDYPAGVDVIREDTLDGGKGVRYLDPPNVPGWVESYPEKQLARANDVLGTGDLLAGKAPPGVTAASAIAYLSDLNDMPIHDLAKERARCWGEFASLVLETYAAKVTSGDRRELEVWDDDVRWTREWSGEMLLGHTRAIVPINAVLPRNRAYAMQVAEQARAAGWVTTAQQYAQIAEGSGHLTDVASVLDGGSDWARARRENRLLAAGHPAVAEPWDDDAIHLQTHLELVKSERWDTMSDQAREDTLSHIAQHETAAAEKAGHLVAQQRVSPALAAAPEVARHHEGVQEALSSLPQAPVEAAPEGGALDAGSVADAGGGPDGLG